MITHNLQVQAGMCCASSSMKSRMGSKLSFAKAVAQKERKNVAPNAEHALSTILVKKTVAAVLTSMTSIDIGKNRSIL